MKVSNMEFRFTDEQRQIVEMVKGLRRRGSGSDRRRDRQNGRVPRQLVDELAELGLMGMPFPEEYGGAGLDYHAYPAALEEISRGSGGLGTIVAAHTSLAGNMLYQFGNEAQKEGVSHAAGRRNGYRCLRAFRSGCGQRRASYGHYSREGW